MAHYWHMFIIMNKDLCNNSSSVEMTYRIYRFVGLTHWVCLLLQTIVQFMRQKDKRVWRCGAVIRAVTAASVLLTLKQCKNLLHSILQQSQPFFYALDFKMSELLERRAEWTWINWSPQLPMGLWSRETTSKRWGHSHNGALIWLWFSLLYSMITQQPGVLILLVTCKKGCLSKWTNKSDEVPATQAVKSSITFCQQLHQLVVTDFHFCGAYQVRLAL